MRRAIRCIVPPERGVAGWTKKLLACGAGTASRCCTGGSASFAALLQKGVFSLKKALESVRLSVQEFGSVRTVAVCGMLIALKFVLGLFTVNVSNLLKVGFAFLPIAAAGMLFGPGVGGTVGALGDILAYFIQPTGPYFPGFTLNAFLSGFLYGLLLYRRALKFGRVCVAKAAVTILVNFLLNPLWLSFLYGKAFWTIVSARAATNLALLPIDVFMLFSLLKILEKCRVPQMMRRNC